MARPRIFWSHHAFFTTAYRLATLALGLVSTSFAAAAEMLTIKAEKPRCCH